MTPQQAKEIIRQFRAAVYEVEHCMAAQAEYTGITDRTGAKTSRKKPKLDPRCGPHSGEPIPPELNVRYGKALSSLKATATEVLKVFQAKRIDATRVYDYFRDFPKASILRGDYVFRRFHHPRFALPLNNLSAARNNKLDYLEACLKNLELHCGGNPELLTNNAPWSLMMPKKEIARILGGSVKSLNKGPYNVEKVSQKMYRIKLTEDIKPRFELYTPKPKTPKTTRQTPKS